MNQEHSPIRVPQIELLRVLAVGGIFLFHLWSVVPQVGDAGAGGELVGRLSSYGYLGVVVFNLITGFVLAWPHLGPQATPAPSYGQFLRKRFLRIVPHYAIALCLWSLVALVLSGGNGVDAFSFASHLLFVHTLFPTAFFSIVPAYWWLGLLAQFYLLFPLLLSFFRAFRPGRACLLVCAVLWPAWLLLSHAAASRPGSYWALINYMGLFNLPFRLPEFAMGMWLAAAWRPGAPSISQKNGTARGGFPLAPSYVAFGLGALALVLIGGTVYPLYGTDSPMDHMYLVACCLVVTLLFILMPFAARLGSRPGTASLASASYSIYLLHQPILGYGSEWLHGAMSPPAAFALLVLGAGLVCLLMSLALDRLVARLEACFLTQNNQSR